MQKGTNRTSWLLVGGGGEQLGNLMNTVPGAMHTYGYPTNSQATFSVGFRGLGDLGFLGGWDKGTWGLGVGLGDNP